MDAGPSKVFGTMLCIMKIMPDKIQAFLRYIGRGVFGVYPRDSSSKLRFICARLAQPVPIPTVPKPNVPLAPPTLTQTVEQAVARSVNRELILRVVRVSVAHAQAVNITIPKERHLAKNAVAEPMPVVPEIPLAPVVLPVNTARLAHPNVKLVVQELIQREEQVVVPVAPNQLILDGRREVAV